MKSLTRRTSFGLAIAALLVGIWGHALLTRAANPGSGTIDGSAPVSWDYNPVTQNLALSNAPSITACDPPSCDQFMLTVKLPSAPAELYQAKTASLLVHFFWDSTPSTTDLDVKAISPSGYSYGPGTPDGLDSGPGVEDLTIVDPEAGTYAIRSIAFQANTPVTSHAVATLTFAPRAANAAALAGEGTWSPLGKGPLDASDPHYGVAIQGQTLLGGRITAFDYDRNHAGRIYASTGGGGVWQSDDMAQHWRSIGDSLPTQQIGGLAWSPAGGGTLTAGSGDFTTQFFGQGIGVFRSVDDGKSWQKASGISTSVLHGMRVGPLTYRVAVDPTDATGNTIYVATSRGLYRSSDAGASFVDVKLPTSPAGASPNCAGIYDGKTCVTASWVTDVVVRPNNPDGRGGGKVMAAVGFPLGQNTGGPFSPSPQNGIYTSPSGLPGTFTFVDPGSNPAALPPTTNGFAARGSTGRVTLGIALGPAQNHDVVYALVQDACLAGGPGCIENDLDLGPELKTRLEGGYVTTDFGQTWTKILDSSQLFQPGTNSSMSPLSHQPGTQSAYDLWIRPDPTATDTSTGVPTRVVFGLEEIWKSSYPGGGPVSRYYLADPPDSWSVIGRYWNNCELGQEGEMPCNTAVGPYTGTTTHPDQHIGLFLADGAGGVTLLAGNDGGVFGQHVAPGQDFTNAGWGTGLNDGFHNLIAYDADVADDGTVIAGLQDNGELRIFPGGKQIEMSGGDGFFGGIDPTNPQNILREFTRGTTTMSSDGGHTFTSLPSPVAPTALFATPIERDTTDPNHYLIGGRTVAETLQPYRPHCADANCATYDNWKTVYDLGTQKHPGDANAAVAANDPNNVTTALDVRGNSAWVAFAGPTAPSIASGSVRIGLASNVGGSSAPKRLAGDGWHIVAGQGLPQRYISSIRMAPESDRTLYVTVRGSQQPWVVVGQANDPGTGAGEGHVFKSTDGGATFTDISGDLPNLPANWSVVHGNNLVVATDDGVFISNGTSGGHYARLGSGLPGIQVMRLRLGHKYPDQMVAATHGRGVYGYVFPGAQPAVVSLPNTGLAGSMRWLPILAGAFALLLLAAGSGGRAHTQVPRF